MRVSKCREKGFEDRCFLLKWGDNETPNLEGVSVMDVGMDGAVAFPKEEVGKVLSLNPGCGIFSLIEAEVRQYLGGL